MKLILKLILTILFVPLFLMLLIGITLRYQLLVTSFWENTFTINSTYSKLSTSINKNLESQVVAEGGKSGDVKTLTDLITAENLKDTISKNINNVLLYANGKVSEITVYMPVGKIPKSLLSISFSGATEQMKLTDLLKEFNVSGISPTQIQMISRLGYAAWLFLITVSLVLILILFLFYILADSGKRLVAPGVALISAALLALLVVASGTIVRINLSKDLAGRSNMGDAIIGIVAPPVIQGILSVWLYFAVGAIIIGVVLLFLKKSGYNKKPK